MRLLKKEEECSNHTGSLLVAMPTLRDPNFSRTILFLSHHDSDEGSTGFILNRPNGQMLENYDVSHERLRRVPVFEGGPVEKQHLLLTLLHWVEGGVRFQSIGKEALDSTTLPEKTESTSAGLRAFIGYAGWSRGQLEYEIAEKSWLILPPSAPLLKCVTTFEEGINQWLSIMRELGSWYRLLAEEPDDPSLN